MKSFTERDGRLIGAVVIVVTVVVVLGVLLLNKSVFTPSYTVHAQFSDAAGIGKGTQVTVAGVKVGSVSGVHVKGDAVIADLAINHDVVLPHQTSAAIEVQTVLGVLDVALQPQQGWANPLRSGATITNTTVPVEFQDLQNTAGNLLQQSDVQAFNQLLTSLAAVTQGKETQVASIISGLDRFTGAIDSRTGEVSGLIDAANNLASTVAQRDQQLAGVVDDLAAVVQGLASHSTQLTTLIAQTDQVAAQTSSLVGQNAPEIQGLVSHLTSVLAVVAQHQEDLAQGVSYLAAAVNGFSSIGYSGPTDSPNSWANIYDNLVGTAGAYGVLGNCAALDTALDEILGPDPLPCDERTGPPPSATGATPSGGPAGTSATSSSSAASTGSTGASGAAAASSSANPLQRLLDPLLGGS